MSHDTSEALERHIVITTLLQRHKDAHDAANALEEDPTTGDKLYCKTFRFTSRPVNLAEPWQYYFTIDSKGMLDIALYIHSLEEFVITARKLLANASAWPGQQYCPDHIWAKAMMEDALVARMIILKKEYLYKDYDVGSLHATNDDFPGLSDSEKKKLDKEKKKLYGVSLG